MPPLRGLDAEGGLGVVTSLQLYRIIGKIACRHNPQPPLRSGSPLKRGHEGRRLNEEIQKLRFSCQVQA